MPSGFSLHFFGGFALTHLRLTDKGNVGSSSLGGPERFGRALTFPLGKNGLLGNHLTTRKPPRTPLRPPRGHEGPPGRGDRAATVPHLPHRFLLRAPCGVRPAGD